MPPGQTPTSVQPGGGWCVHLEIGWGKIRRGVLRTLFPGYVRRMLEKRQGACPACPHDIIDPRDLKYVRNVCGYWFRPEDDRFQWRGKLGLARHGLVELIVFSLLFVSLSAAFATLALLVHGAFWIPFVPAVLTWLEVVYFFRDPTRLIPPEASVLVSPADGKVTNVEEVDDPDFPGGRALRISIFLSIFNVHVNRMPRSARVTRVLYFPGEYLDARNPNSAVRNEQLWVDFEEPDGNMLRVKQISGAIARRIVCWLKAGDMLEKGERIGMIKFGSRTDLLLPATLRVDVAVKPGDTVKGGSTILLRYT